MYSVYFFCPYVSEVTVIRGWHRSVYPVIFPSSARSLNREGGSVTSLLRTATGEGGTLFTQILSVRKGVVEVTRPPQGSSAPGRPPQFIVSQT